MTRLELKDYLNVLTNQFPKNYSQKLKTNKSALSDLYEYTKSLEFDGLRLMTRIYWILHDIYSESDIPLCLNSSCRKSLSNRNIKNLQSGYRRYCCGQCAKDSEDRKALYMATCQKKYNCANASSSKLIKDRRKKTMLDIYGVDNPMKLDSIRKKVQFTNFQKYGVSFLLQDKAFIEKTRATCLDRYGVSSFSKTNDYIIKTQATNNLKFGVDYPMQNIEFRQKAQSKYRYTDMSFDSAPELAFYIWHVDHNIAIQYQPCVFEYEYNGKTHKYMPDFLVDDTQLIEIKGLQFFEDKNIHGRMINPFDRMQDGLYESKHQCMIRNNVKILTESDYIKYIKYIKMTYGKNYLAGFKNT